MDIQRANEETVVKRFNKIMLMAAAAALATGCASAPPPLPSQASVYDYQAGYGRLVVDSPELDYFTYVPVLEEAPNKSKLSEVVLPKGDYSVIVRLKDATTYSATVRVSGDMETATVKPVSKPRHLEKIASGLPAEYILPFGEGRFLVYDDSNKPLVYTAKGQDKAAKIPLNRVTLGCYLSDHQVLLLGDKTKAFLFDSNTGTSVPFAPDGVRWDTLPFDSGICVAGAAQFAVGGQITRIGLDGPEVVELPEPGLISANEDGSLMADAVGSVTAAVQGDDYIFPGSEAGFPAEFPDSLLGNKLVITSQGDRREVDLGELTGVFAVSLSPD
ncbi:MAG: hypothetical protein LBI99_03595, partial [Propionibacteriaceae bacterium]|nr:hypothetical protein [Propionibacteriaceae bacterium]